MASKWPSHNIIIAALRANQITELDCNLIANAYTDENGGKPSARAIGDRIDAWKKESGCSTLIVTNRRPEKKGLAAGKKRRLKQEPSHTEGCSTATDTEASVVNTPTAKRARANGETPTPAPRRSNRATIVDSAKKLKESVEADGADSDDEQRAFTTDATDDEYIIDKAIPGPKFVIHEDDVQDEV